MIYEVISPYSGEIYNILYSEASYIYPGETIILISTESGLKELIIDCYASIEKIEVAEGDKVIPGMILAHVQYLGDGQ